MWLSKYGREWLAKPVEWIVAWLHRLGVTPNAVTYTSFVLTVGTALLLATGYFIAGGLILIFASLLDLIDGSLARATGQSSTFGAFIDSTLDRYSESVTFGALAYYYAAVDSQPLMVLLVFATIVGSLMVSYTRARAEGLNIECKEGWLQRPERIFALIVGLLTGWMLPVLALLAIGTNLTAIQRIYQVYWKIQEAETARGLALQKEP
jgi:CDP-diacylglycerol--glycerol-3-phosphate 3-phosphatidyltransferase